MYGLHIFVSVVASLLVAFFGTEVSQYAADRFHGWTTIAYVPPPPPLAPYHIPNADDWASTYYTLGLFNNSIIPPPPSPLFTNIFRTREIPPVASPQQNASATILTPEWAGFFCRLLYDVLAIAMHQYISVARLAWERKERKKEATEITTVFAGKLLSMSLQLKVAMDVVARFRRTNQDNAKDCQAMEQRLKQMHEVSLAATEAVSEVKRLHKEELEKTTATLRANYEAKFHAFKAEQGEIVRRTITLDGVHADLLTTKNKCARLEEEAREKDSRIFKNNRKLAQCREAICKYQQKQDDRAETERLHAEDVAKINAKHKEELKEDREAFQQQGELYSSSQKETDELRKELDKLKASDKKAERCRELEKKKALEEMAKLQKEVRNLKSEIGAVKKEKADMETELAKEKADMKTELAKENDEAMQLAMHLQDEELEAAKEEVAGLKAQIAKTKLSEEAKEASSKAEVQLQDVQEQQVTTSSPPPNLSSVMQQLAHFSLVSPSAPPAPTLHRAIVDQEPEQQEFTFNHAKQLSLSPPPQQDPQPSGSQEDPATPVHENSEMPPDDQATEVIPGLGEREIQSQQYQQDEPQPSMSQEGPQMPVEENDEVAADDQETELFPSLQQHELRSSQHDLGAFTPQEVLPTPANAEAAELFPALEEHEILRSHVANDDPHPASQEDHDMTIDEPEAMPTTAQGTEPFTAPEEHDQGQGEGMDIEEETEAMTVEEFDRLFSNGQRIDLDEKMDENDAVEETEAMTVEEFDRRFSNGQRIDLDEEMDENDAMEEGEETIVRELIEGMVLDSEGPNEPQDDPMEDEVIFAGVPLSSAPALPPGGFAQQFGSPDPQRQFNFNADPNIDPQLQLDPEYDPWQPALLFGPVVASQPDPQSAVTPTPFPAEPQHDSEMRSREASPSSRASSPDPMQQAPAWEPSPFSSMATLLANAPRVAPSYPDPIYASPSHVLVTPSSSSSAAAPPYVLSNSSATPYFSASLATSAPPYRLPGLSTGGPPYIPPSSGASAPPYRAPSSSTVAPPYIPPSSGTSAPPFSLPGSSSRAPPYILPSSGASAAPYTCPSPTTHAAPPGPPGLFSPQRQTAQQLVVPRIRYPEAPSPYRPSPLSTGQLAYPPELQHNQVQPGPYDPARPQQPPAKPSPDSSASSSPLSSAPPSPPPSPPPIPPPGHRPILRARNRASGPAAQNTQQQPGPSSDIKPVENPHKKARHE